MGFNGLIVLAALMSALGIGLLGGYFETIGSLWKIPCSLYTLFATLFAFIYTMKTLR